MTKIEFKCKIGSGWRPLPSHQVAGKTLLAIFNSCAGRDVVAKLGDEWMICGTPEWEKYYGKKYRAVSFIKAVNVLRETKPELLDIVLLPDDVAEVFPEAGLKEFSYE